MARPIPPPRVQFCDPDTGLITQPWYEYFSGRDRSSAVAWFYGSDVPSNSLGLNGDFYIRTSGNTIVAFYVKQNGVWT